jgi:hypothetical protein
VPDDAVIAVEERQPAVVIGLQLRQAIKVNRGQNRKRLDDIHRMRVVGATLIGVV